MEQKVIVVGAGVIGVSCAVCIKEAFPHVDVEIVAEHFSPDTTSDGSGGFWEPYALGKTDPHLIRDLSSETLVYLKKLGYSQDAAEAGVCSLSGYSLYTTVVQKASSFSDLVEGYRRLESSEVERFPRAKSGYFHTTMQVDVSTYLPWMMMRFKAMGGKMRRAKITSLGELRGECHVVVNCCGIGARQLVNDTDIVPIRGQVLRVEAPWVKHFYLLLQEDGYDVTYILPGTKNVVIGGTADAGEWDTRPSPEVAHRIWDTATQFLPMLKDAKVVKSWAGLRPGRTSLRLEQEDLITDEEPLKIIHNYGHGGAGVTLHWGCALHVTQMVKDQLDRCGSRTRGKAKL